ncbi:MAG: vWA domain-containing protein [Chloroflexota bacterium]
MALLETRTIQCESPDNPNPHDLPYTDECLDGASSSWQVVEERRIYAVKQALIGLVDNMQENDSMRVVAYADSISETNVRAYPADGMTGDKDILNRAIRDAGDWGQGPYTTRGGNSSAQAMQSTGQLLEQAPDRAPDGSEYKDVVIYVTDGVANIFLDGETNTARNIPFCRDMSVAEALRTANPCQLGITADGRLRPVTALINEAIKIKQNDPDLDLYVLAIGPADDTGLAQVASEMGLFYPANTPSVVDNIFALIAAQSNAGTCRVTEGEATSDISGHEAGSLPDFPVPEGGHGYVTIRDSQGNVLPEGQGRLPVVVDPVSGNLVYRLPVEMGLAPGEYSLEAYINYRGDDGTARTYRQLVITNDPDGTSLLRFTIPSNAVGDVYTMDSLLLDIAPDVALCPASPME